eukprot:CAMPEP_0168570090 /NCGR_PEP_ID=MMETSP0413-20121227/16532_1 /TAXON_ID=136452 /ORGANISM="Filamoeba nolandi, Strain NC-AS-23-1" /LENGTH=150 /DNA_ID=CAMNT_0008602683 /DNA_START=29 /DNA_END=481 /DNA_ORIENTATION=-
MKAINIRPPTIAVRPASFAIKAPRVSSIKFQATKLNASVPRLTVQKRFFADTWNDREQGIENYAAKKHDEELLRKLREAEEARAKAEARAQAAEEKNGGAAAPASREPTDYVTMHEFLEFRQELVEKIRDLEDEIHKLQVSKYEKRRSLF